MKASIVGYASALLLGGAVVFATGCGGKKNEGYWPKDADGRNTEVRVPRPEPAAPEVTAAPAPPPATKPAGETAVKLDQGTGGYTESGNAQARPEVRAVPELPPVYFEFDKSELSESAKKALDQHVQYIKTTPEIHVVLRGHTDDSGTEEYNISLGSRRAQAVRDHLIQKGVPGKRIETISFGEGLPIAEGSTDQAHQQNRRVEFFLYVPE